MGDRKIQPRAILTTRAATTYAIVVVVEKYADEALDVSIAGGRDIEMVRFLREVQGLPAANVKVFGSFRDSNSEKEIESLGISGGRVE